MKILIVEDELPAANRLKKLISETGNDFSVEAVTQSISETVTWLASHSMPDLVLMDIQLSDGISFEIFNKTKLTCPVIFITAYDQYALQAFKVNSIDYLLKPVKKEELNTALHKFLSSKKVLPGVDYNQVAELILKRQHEYQKRIVIRYRDLIKTIEITQVAYFYLENKITYLCTFHRENTPVDYTLDQLETLLDPAVFFRINRQFIVNFKAIEKMVSYTKSRVKLSLNPPIQSDTIVSTERSPVFKEWLEGRHG